MPSGYHPYRSSGYNILFPRIERKIIKSIKDHAFPKKPSPIIRSMVSYTKDKCLKLMDAVAKLSAGEMILFRDEIDKLGFSAYEYMTPHTSVDDDIDREVGDIVVVSYPDHILVEDKVLGYESKGVYVEVSLIGYFYK